MNALAPWQSVVVGVVAVAAFAFIFVVVARLQFRRGASSALARIGTPLESARYGACAAESVAVFDGFSYRVGARFAGRARVVVDGGRVSICGPRGPYLLYWLWIWLMSLTIAAALPLLALAIVDLSWQALLWAVLALVVSTLIMAVGAGVWPGLGEVPGLTEGLYPALEHPLSAVRDLRLGSGWANGGLGWVLLPYVGGIDKLAEGHAVSWFGPDERGREVRYAFHCYELEQASALYALLGAGGDSVETRSGSGEGRRLRS